MFFPACFKKRLEDLEKSFDLEGSRAIKVFIYYPEEDIPYWDPESPEAWREAHPKGHAVILERRNCRINRREINDSRGIPKEITSY
ncbi:hypothetical protein MSKOL_1831 [Methanosarcina sp. Kolksee]|uniref:hypothetical protein n=1 Tax=Methanosarcina sp. Kolksee TaxID=1434099 RepID=UPI0006160F9F|nr:hypothetical protein [Methanosarcina sp. Kolksee]AKB47608.1 hypothetical protein MSKOL_1831 [Methanosarcina sp. Kolksee]